MDDREQINADQRTFWNGQGGRTWVERQEHTDIFGAGVGGVARSGCCVLRRSSAGSRLWLRSTHVGHCARRRPIGMRGSLRHLWTDVG